jgi:hypothetical protein
MTRSRAVWLRGLMSPNPTVLNTGIVKYRASVRDIASLKPPAALRSSR